MMRWRLSRCALIVSTLDFLENPPWGFGPKTDLPNASQFNEYSVIERYWKIIDVLTIIHLSPKLNTVQNSHLQEKNKCNQNSKTNKEHKK